MGKKYVTCNPKENVLIIYSLGRYLSDFQLWSRQLLKWNIANDWSFFNCFFPLVKFLKYLSKLVCVIWSMLSKISMVYLCVHSILLLSKHFVWLRNTMVTISLVSICSKIGAILERHSYTLPHSSCYYDRYVRNEKTFFFFHPIETTENPLQSLLSVYVP